MEISNYGCVLVKTEDFNMPAKPQDPKVKLEREKFKKLIKLFYPDINDSPFLI